MGSENKRRTEMTPFSVRLSPDERAAFVEKAKRAGMTISDAARAALVAWRPETQAREEPTE